MFCNIAEFLAFIPWCAGLMLWHGLC